MHSSRMRTVRSSGRISGGGGVPGPGGGVPGQVPSPLDRQTPVKT